jgi:hypothetical protein
VTGSDLVGLNIAWLCSLVIEMLCRLIGRIIWYHQLVVVDHGQGVSE